MPSLLEIYKEKNSRQNEDNLTELEKLYNQSSLYKNKYTFNEFVSIATKNSDNPLDDSILNILNPIEDEEDEPLSSEVRKTYKAPSSLLQAVGLSPEKRKVVGGIADVVSRGTLNLFTRDLPNFLNTFGQDEVIKQLAKSSGKSESEIKLEIEQQQTQAIKEGVATVGKPLFGPDIYDNVDIKDPETASGELVKNIGGFAASLFTTPKKIFGLGAKKVDDFVGPLPTKTAQVAAIKNATRQRRLRLAGQLGRAEVASQIAFEDSPELLMVANGLNSLLQSTNLDDSTIGAIVNWLDADEDDTAAQRRLSLLLDGGVIGGVVGGVLFVGGKAVKYSYNSLLSAVKKNPKAIQILKDKFKPILSRSDKVDDVFVEAEGLNAKTNILNFFRNVRRKFFTSRGYRSDEMYKIMNQSKAAKEAYGLEAQNIFNFLSVTMKQLANDSSYSLKDIDNILESYLVGKTNLKSLPKDLQPIAKDTKNKIDELSELMLGNDMVPKELKNVIRLNMGKYLRKTYQLYENPNYKPSQEVIDKAVAHISEALANAPVQTSLFGKQGQKLTKTEAEQKAKEIVRDILSGGKTNQGLLTNVIDHLNVVFGANKAEIIFATRKDIDEPIRKLLGEVVEDTPTSVYRTITNLSNFITDTKLYNDLYEAGAGKWFYDDAFPLPVGSNINRTKGIIKGEGFGKLDGARTTSQIAEYFNSINRVKESGPFSRFWSSILVSKGLAQAYQTVYSITTWARNTIGGGIIMASNGLNPFDKETAEAFITLKNEIATSTLGKRRELQKLYVKYKRLGLVNQNVRAGEFNQLIDEVANVNWINNLNESFKSKAYNNTKQLVKDTHSKIQDIYVAQDDIWRIAAFQKELKVLQRAFPNKSLQELEQQAANIIRDTMPTYDMVPEGAKALRRLPIGNFFSFQAERFRNNYHTIMQGRKEILSDNEVLRQRGIQRLASKTVFGAFGGKGVNEFTKFAFGVSDEEEQAIKDVLLPDYSKYSELAFYRNELGNLEYVDTSYTDPDAPVLNVFRASLDALFDPDVPDAAISERLAKGLIIDPAIEFLRPFVSEALLTTALREAYIGRDKDGRPIEGWNPENDAVTNAMAVANRVIYEELIPLQLTEIADKIGDKEDFELIEYALSELTGQRFYEVNSESIEKGLGFKMRDFTRGKKNASSIFTSNIQNSKTTEDLLNAYLDANKAYYRIAVKARKAIDGAKILNVPYERIELVVKDSVSGFRKEEINSLLSGNVKFSPLQISDAVLKNIYNKNDFINISYSDFKKEYNLMYSKLSRLPLIKLKEYDNQTQEALDMIKSPVKDIFRSKKARGGLIEGEDNVPFTKEDPADRINPYTGRSYKENRERLAIGGVLSSVLAASKKYSTKQKTKDKSFLDKKEVEIETFDTLKDVGITKDKVEVQKIRDEFKAQAKQDELDYGLPHRVKQDEEILKAALKLSDNEITVKEYRDLVLNKNKPREWKEVPAPTPIKDIAVAVTGKTKDIDKINRGIYNFNKSIPEGALIGLRLDIPAYNSYNKWVVAIHKGSKAKTDPKAIVGFGQTGWLKNVTFEAPPRGGFMIATQQINKSTIARMEGRWKNHTTEEAVNAANKFLTDKNWTQIGYNPYRVSYFYDRKTMNPVISADEVIQIGPFVIGKNVVKGKPTDKRFEVVFPKEGKRFNFKKGGKVSTNEQMNRLGLKHGGPHNDAEQYSSDPFIQSIIEIESSSNPNAESPIGAKGLMQIREETARQPGYGVKPFQGDNLFDPKENVRFGTDYIYAMIKKYGNKRDAAIAYNWGPGNTNRWIKDGSNIEALPKETQNYLTKLKKLGQLD